jgi:predicted MFS family arabinose efflux permease
MVDRHGCHWWFLVWSVSGAMLSMKRAFDLTAEEQEVVVSSTVLAAFLVSLVGGTRNATAGRRFSILLAAAVFCMGSVWRMVAWNYRSLVVGRIVVARYTNTVTSSKQH